jgi:uncharacterized protein (TIGR02266 family)
VTDPLSTSRTARENLAKGLNALQADPSVPKHLVELAAPIAQAMGALHQLEKTSQLVPHADVALNHVRGALAQLQAQPPTHPAVSAALEAVATSLSLVHTLSKMGNGPAPASAPLMQHMHQQPPPVQHSPSPHKGGTGAMPQKAPKPPTPPAQAAVQPPPQPVQAPPPMVSRDPFAAPPAVPARPSAPVPAPPPQGNAQVINADLGAHSPTNFYKGLSGNDIIDHGGLFVSTYVSPKIGTPVRLKVSLPGGYEFEANAVVKWTREQGGDAPPGFGAQFTQITPEARQLVYRYVRNREPIFHDDL